MTKREQEKIEKAIKLLQSDDGDAGNYGEAMEILCGLIHWKCPDLSGKSVTGKFIA